MLNGLTASTSALWPSPHRLVIIKAFLRGFELLALRTDTVVTFAAFPAPTFELAETAGQLISAPDDRVLVGTQHRDVRLDSSDLLALVDELKQFDVFAAGSPVYGQSVERADGLRKQFEAH